MLRFGADPDPVFTALVNDALERGIEEIQEYVLTEHPPEGEETWRALFPYAAHNFSPAVALETLQHLRTAHVETQAVYEMTDYHRLLLYYCLKSFCEVWNDHHRESGASAYSFVGPFKVRAFEFGGLVDTFFPDTDFLVQGEAMIEMPEETRASYSSESFGLSQGLAPHPDELRLVAEPATPSRAFAPVPAPSVVLVSYPSDGFPPTDEDDSDEEAVPTPLFTLEMRGAAFEHWWAGHHRQLGGAETTARFHAAMFAVFSRMPLEDAYTFLVAEPILQGPHNAPKRPIGWEHGNPVYELPDPLIVRIPPQACATEPKLAHHLARHAALAIYLFGHHHRKPGSPEATKFIEERLTTWNIPRSIKHSGSERNRRCSTMERPTTEMDRE